MLSGIEHLFGPLFEKWIGAPAMFGGIILALSGWFIDYAVIERRRRKGYAILLAVFGAGLLGIFLYADWDACSLIKSMIIALPSYFLLRRSIRRAH
jgi:hypothetical protein